MATLLPSMMIGRSSEGSFTGVGVVIMGRPPPTPPAPPTRVRGSLGVKLLSRAMTLSSLASAVSDSSTLTTVSLEKPRLTKKSTRLSCCRSTTWGERVGRGGWLVGALSTSSSARFSGADILS